MLTCQKSLFRLSDDVTYLNCAYMGPLLKSVAETGKKAIDRKLRPSEIEVEEFFQPTEQIRSEFASLINCPDPKQVVLIPSVSYGIANAANNLSIPAGSKILIAGEQFPSNAYPWFRAAELKRAKLEIVSAPSTKTDRGLHWNDQFLESIDDNTSVVAVSINHWTDGTRFNLKEIRKKTIECGAALIVDGTQSIGAFPFDWQEINPEALICAGYKWLLGPYSLGLACYGQSLNDGIPLEENWINRKNSENFAGLVDYEPEYQPGALRYEVGEHSNFILVPILLESIRQIRNWEPGRIQDYCKSITHEAVQTLRENGFWIEKEEWRANHLFGIRIPDSVSIESVKKEFSRANIFVSFRGSSIRVSPHLYNTEEDLKKLAECLLKLLK